MPLQYTCLTTTVFWDQTWWSPEEFRRRFGESHYSIFKVEL
jgi:hypothetical protein